MKNRIYGLLVTTVSVFCSLAASAQMKTSYFMESAIPRYDMNAALTPAYGYVNFPLLSFGANVNNNFLSVDNFIYPRGAKRHRFVRTRGAKR